MRRCAVLVILGVFLALCAWPPTAGAKEKTKSQQRADIRKMERETLAKLYKANPGARGAIGKGAGYAVFDNFGAHILLLSTVRGKGIAVDNKTKKVTYMKMFSAGAGLGMGVKDFRAVFIFETKTALDDFIQSGWDASGQAEAAAKSGEKGGAYSGATSVAPGVWVYQLTEAGLALHATLQGTKYYKDDDLN